MNHNRIDLSILAIWCLLLASVSCSASVLMKKKDKIILRSDVSYLGKQGNLETLREVVIAVKQNGIDILEKMLEERSNPGKRQP